MPNKADKFGMKFGSLQNRAQIGAIEKDSRLGVPLAEHVLSVTEVLKNKGYNVTTDNFFLHHFKLQGNCRKEQIQLLVLCEQTASICQKK